MQLKTLTLVALASAASAQTLPQALAGVPSLSNLTSYLGLFPDFSTQLASQSNITLLAPNNGAFTKALNNPAAAAALNDSAYVQAVFSYHVLQGTYRNFSAMPAFVPTLLTNQNYSQVTGGQVVEALVGEGNTTIVYSGLHLNSTVVNTVNFTGGVIHIIDTFLTPPVNVSTTAIAADLTAAVGALNRTSLVNTVDTTPDLTLFVPNNAAFQAIGSALRNISIEDLTSVLQYHVVKGTVAYSSTLTNTTVTSLQGGDLTITVVNATVFVNSARVILPDVLVANGVVHVIDAVLNPLNTTATANPTASSQAPAFTGASKVSNVPFTSGVPTPTGNSATTVPTASAGATSTAGASPVMTAAVGMGALFGGAAVLMNM